MPILSIEPRSVQIAPFGAQTFVALLDGQPTSGVEWSIEPKKGTIQGGVYVAPGASPFKKSVTIIAQKADLSASASVELLSVSFWTGFLGLYWIVVFVLLIVLLISFWSKMCPSCASPEVVLNPAIVTLTGNEVQQFTANVPVTWSNPLTSNGLFTDSVATPVDKTLNVTATASDKKSGTATIIQSKNWGLVVAPDRAIVLHKDQDIELRAQITGKGDDPSGTATPQVIRWLSPAAGTYIPTPKSLDPPPFGRIIRYKAPSDIRKRQVITVMAQLEDARPPKVAGVNIILSDDSSACAIDVDEAKDLELFLRSVGMILLAGALGGLVHGVSSFATYVGNQKLLVSWVWWYALRPFIGALVAFMVFLVFRGGFSGNDLSLGGADCLRTAAFSGLIGLFSEPALLKLRDIFDTLFTVKNDPRANPLDGKNVRDTGRKPQIDRVQPSSVSLNQDVIITLFGNNFAPGCEVKIGSLQRRPTSVGKTEIQMALKAAELQAPGALQVVIVNTPPDGDLSDSVQLLVNKV